MTKIELSGALIDWKDPLWERDEKCHNWRNYASVDLQLEWPNLSNEQKIVISSNLQEIADQECWE